MHLEFANHFASAFPIFAAASNTATNAVATAAAAAAPKSSTTINAPNSFDIVLGIVLVVGIIRGRKRGMSEELLDVVKWLLVVFLGAVFYKPLGDLVSQLAGLPKVWSYIICYALVLIIVLIVFSS